MLLRLKCFDNDTEIIYSIKYAPDILEINQCVENFLTQNVLSNNILSKLDGKEFAITLKFEA